tara:strand:- start:21 stop:146 length:126 start_codon:yes stop_codon:yes gene_type:complete
MKTAKLISYVLGIIAGLFLAKLMAQNREADHPNVVQAAANN